MRFQQLIDSLPIVGFFVAFVIFALITAEFGHRYAPEMNADGSPGQSMSEKMIGDACEMMLPPLTDVMDRMLPLNSNSNSGALGWCSVNSIWGPTTVEPPGVKYRLPGAKPIAA